MISLFAIIVFVTAALYASLIVWFFVGWVRSKGLDIHSPGIQMGEPENIYFSVVVAVRNEASRINVLLDALSKQKWPAGQFEVIVVDDHSTDDTLDLVQAVARNSFRLCVRTISSEVRGSLPGKKHALDLGIRDARGNFIVTTDADCQPQPRWLQAIASCIHATKSDMVMGPVQIDGSPGHFAKMQELEFMSLMGITAGSAAVGNPILANGANLTFRKELYVSVDGYEGNMQYASGDDVFLLQKFKRLPGCRLVFLKERAAIVKTAASTSLGVFFRQRGRWAGKAVGYKDGFTLFVGAMVAMINTMLVVSLLLIPYRIWLDAGSTSFIADQPKAASWFENLISSDTTMLFAALAFAWLMKFLTDLLILIPVADFFRRRRLLWYLLPVFLVYPLYVVISLIRGLRG